VNFEDRAWLGGSRIIKLSPRSCPVRPVRLMRLMRSVMEAPQSSPHQSSLSLTSADRTFITDKTGRFQSRITGLLNHPSATAVWVGVAGLIFVFGLASVRAPSGGACLLPHAYQRIRKISSKSTP
jgi:hypothetical protein